MEPTPSNPLAEEIIQKLLSAGVDAKEMEAVLAQVHSGFIGRISEATRAIVKENITSINASQGATGSLETHEDEQQLMDEIVREGRIRANTSITMDLKGKGRSSGGGFQSIGEVRFGGNPFAESPNTGVTSWNQLGGNGATNLMHFLKSQNACAAIGLGPLMRVETVYEPPSSGLRKIWKGQPKPIGSKKVPVPLGKFLGNRDSANAFEIVYFVGGEDHDGSYADPTTGRAGNYLCISIVMPEALAQRVYTFARKHPTFLRRVSEKMWPELIKEQETRGERGLPKEKRTIFVNPVADDSKWIPIQQRSREVVDVDWG